MTDSWDERRKALENEYFDRKNKEALSKLAAEKRSAEELTASVCSKTGQVTFEAQEFDRLIAVIRDAGCPEVAQLLGSLKNQK